MPQKIDRELQDAQMHREVRRVLEDITRIIEASYSVTSIAVVICDREGNGKPYWSGSPPLLCWGLDYLKGNILVQAMQPLKPISLEEDHASD